MANEAKAEAIQYAFEKPKDEFYWKLKSINISMPDKLEASTPVRAALYPATKRLWK